jgi:hypothetical protein
MGIVQIYLCEAFFCLNYLDWSKFYLVCPDILGGCQNLLRGFRPDLDRSKLGLVGSNYKIEYILFGVSQNLDQPKYFRQKKYVTLVNFYYSYCRICPDVSTEQPMANNQQQPPSP